MADNGLSRGQFAFMSALLLAGLGLLGWAGYRVMYPPRQRSDLAKQAEEDLEQRGFKPLSEELEKLINDPKFTPMATQASPLLGQDAPDFALPVVGGEEWKFSQRKRGPLLLVFYYGYHCPHCVSQLYALDKDIAKFKELGVEVVAISPDTTAHTLGKYREFEKEFGFTVLSDEDNEVARKYGAYRPGPKGEQGELSHATFVISREGKVLWLNKGAEPFTDNRTLLVELAKAR
jgi:peroxiredoxin